IGFPAGVTHTAKDYVDTARLLASNPALLAAARRNLRGDLAKSPLGDREDHARTLEAALRAVWRLHCAGERPER
ncbi:MAG: hypothetical protein R3349_07435, partial [Geminicoccaceae bacterium]|nr:hypothetical protein [Geminicoccaceae bacterium]